VAKRPTWALWWTFVAGSARRAAGRLTLAPLPPRSLALCRRAAAEKAGRAVREAGATPGATQPLVPRTTSDALAAVAGQNGAGGEPPRHAGESAREPPLDVGGSRRTPSGPGLPTASRLEFTSVASLFYTSGAVSDHIEALVSDHST
jgi:hypothetical protein